jgi:putative tryptophan/tyrosine transport system substrate-binding protein
VGAPATDTFGQTPRGDSADSAQASGATALNVLSSPLFFAHLHLILDRAAALRLPAIYDFPEMAEEGGFALARDL